ncbi:MAG: hypothetical protein WAU78_01165, partial [Roseiarcus sp.]
FGGKNHPTLDSQSRAAVSHNPHINAVSQTLWHSRLTTPWELLTNARSRQFLAARTGRSPRAAGASTNPRKE